MTTIGGHTEFQRETRALVRDAKTRAKILLGIVALMWLAEIADTLLGHRLLLLGIVPRTLVGLRGILFAPLLHAGFWHLAANTIPFLVLGWLVMLDRIRDFVVVTALVMLLGGFGVWLIGPAHSIHIGASGLIFGYLGFLLLRGFFQRSPAWIALAIFVGLAYGGLLWGVLPTLPGVSWQSHLCGLLAGAFAARRFQSA